MDSFQLENCCTGLESAKVTERRRNADLLWKLLENKETVLNVDNEGWNTIILSVHKFLLKEAEKLEDDEHKKKPVSQINVNGVKRCCSDLLVASVRQANTQETKLNVSVLIECILECFNRSSLKRFFCKGYLTVLKDHILLRRSYWCKIEPDEWTKLLSFVGSIIQNPIRNVDEKTPLQCLHLILKHGPLHSLPSSELRKQFPLIQQIAQIISSSSPRWRQETVLDLLLEFCIQTAEDNRVSCCKLGEELFSNFLELFQTQIHSSVKVLILKFLLLQVQIHHPNGSTENSESAYAYNWQNWSKQLRSTYSILCYELNNNTRLKSKSNLICQQQTPYDMLEETFTALLVEVFKQVFSTTKTSPECSQPPAKRQKVQAGISGVITNIKEAKDWPWINALSALIKKYCDLLKPDDFLNLLQVLSANVSGSKCLSTRHHIYDCLIVLTEIESKLNISIYFEDVQSLWSTIVDCILRTIGPDEKNPQIHKLLQNLILMQKVKESAQLFGAFTSHGLNVNRNSIATLNLSCSRFGLPEIRSASMIVYPEDNRKMLLKWILQSKPKDTSVFSENITAETLIAFVFKQWPVVNASENYEPNSLSKNNCLQAFEEMYLVTSLNRLLISSNNDSLTTRKDQFNKQISFSYYSKTVQYLIELLNEFVMEFINDESGNWINLENTMNITILLANVMSLMIKYNLILEGDVEDHALIRVMQLSLQKSCAILSTLLGMSSGRHHVDILNAFLRLKKLLELNIENEIFLIVRKAIDIELLKKLFNILNGSSSNVDETEEFKDQIKLAHGVLCAYSYVPNKMCIFDVQQQVFEALIQASFSLEKNDNECKVAMAFLKLLGTFKSDVLDDQTLNIIFKGIQDVCEMHYENYEVALSVLNALQCICSYDAILNNDEFKDNLVRLLHPFYNRYRSYSPDVLVAIVNCMGQLVKLSAALTWPDSDKEIAFDIPKFLHTESQRVRFATVKNLVILFQLPCDGAPEMIRQSSLFKSICVKCTEMLQINGNLNEESRLDETITHTASALQAFTAIMITSVVLRRKALFSLLKLVHEKQLNLDSLLRILGLCSKCLNVDSSHRLLELNLSYLLSKWQNSNYDLSEFPFGLLQCESSVEFFTKYTNVLVPILIESDISLLSNTCKPPQKNIQEIVEMSYPIIIAKCILIKASENLNSCTTDTQKQITSNNKTFENLTILLSRERLNELLIEKLTEVISNLVQFCCDQEDLREKFDVHCVLPSHCWPNFPVSVILRAFQYIEVNYLNETNLMIYCLKNCQDVIEKILMKTISNVHKSLCTEEKVMAFHQYTIIVDLLLPLLKEDNILRTYIVRTVSYTLIHLVNDSYKNYSMLNVICCKYFTTFLSKILPKNSKIIERYLVSFVNILIPIAMCNNELGLLCTKLLNLLIIDHADDLVASIKLLDPFPPNPKFKQIQTVYEKIKYKHKTFNLEDEIRHFLTTGEVMDVTGYRTEGLKHLKKQLSTKKIELKELYTKLKNIRGFSENCEESILHRLVCTLINLSLSTDVNESTEASWCLGELGPADLLTTILNAETQCTPSDSTTFELVTGCVISLLSKYIVHSDIEVMEASSTALYHVLNCKEARTALGSGIDYGFGLIDQAYISPYIPSKRVNSRTDYSVKSNFRALINNDDLWYSEKSHSEWITELVSALLQTFSDKCYLKELIPVCKVMVNFAESILPLLVYLILFSRYTDVVSSQIHRFFHMHWTDKLQGRNNNVGSNKRSVQCMLNVVQFIRVRKNVENQQNLRDLSINYLYVAQAAQFCSAHFTALLYIELWYQERIKEIRIESERSGTILRSPIPLEIVLQYEEFNVQQTLQNILREAYTKIGEPDALHACETVDLYGSRLHVEHYEHSQQWHQLALFYDIQISQGDHSCTPKLVEAFKNCGLFNSCLKYNTNTEPQFECLWRLSKWNVNEMHIENSVGYEKYHYFALKALHDDDDFNFKNAIADARNSIIDSLRNASLECCENLYEPLSKFQSLMELEDLKVSKYENQFDLLIEKWKVQDEINMNEFKYIEPICSQRIVTFNDLISNNGREMLNDSLIHFHFKLIDLARSQGNLNIAHRTLRNLSQNLNLQSEVKNKIKLEEAHLCWLSDKSRACAILNSLLKESLNPRLNAAALKLYGTWMIEMCLENPQTIVSDYFIKSLDILNSLQDDKTPDDNANIYETYNILAKFTDAQYQQVLSYTKSSVFERKVRNMEKAKETAMNIRNKHGTSNDEKKALHVYIRQSKIDESEIKTTHKEKDSYLAQAIKYYMWNLQHSDLNNVCVFRLLSLWLENRSASQVEELLKNDLPKIPSYKFICILPQLIPHINNNKTDSFSNQITSIVERCAIDHPHHTLPVILALANSNSDEYYFESTSSTTSNESRVAGAEALIEKLRKSRPNLKDLIDKMQILSKALVNLAYVDINKCKNHRKFDYFIPESCKITKIRNFDNILVPTYDLPIKKNCNYDQIIGIRSFSRIFTRLGGINEPKRIICIGTDGRERRQLVKGKDDLRQDAVMQQVFNIMNGLFSTNKQTMKLLIRTYKIVPLSQRSGILEWNENSIPLCTYLIGDTETTGAHQKYNPDDMTPSRCRSSLKSVSTHSPEEKLVTYQNICRKFKPVFHKFFEESFVQPAVWYERRQAYMHSVATSSICGYILGLGDRHLQNILIDTVTAEVIHIDFGIAFEQGLVLPTPETVPFRLTRDIEDGMGILGVKGVFQKSCERTLEVLRTNANTIITILEVLLYDPLYAWTITPAEAYSHQFKYDQSAADNNALNFSEQDEVTINTTAERALLRLKEKLNGTAEGGSTSIEGQVEKLIQQARDPANLCRLFNGWQAYL